MKRPVRCHITQAWKLWAAATKKTGHGWSERLALLLEWGPGDDMDLGDWRAAYADALPAGLPNDPANWRPVWGWGRALPPNTPKTQVSKAAAAKARKRLEVLKRARAAAQVAAKTKREAEFKAVFKQVRKCTLKGREMGSISDVLKAANTSKAQQVRPTLGEKMGATWPRRFQWNKEDYGRHASCSSRRGGGRDGHCGTQEVLCDIYDFVKPPLLP